jgi:mannosyltransferase
MTRLSTRISSWLRPANGGAAATAAVPDAGASGGGLRERLGSLDWVGALGLLLPMAVLFVLSLQALGAVSFWRDEVSTVYFAEGSLGDLLTIIGRDRTKVGLANMATFYLILHFWLFVGETEARVRFLSVIFGVAAVVPVWLVARRLAGSIGAAIAAGTFALIPFVIAYNQEARGYSLAVLICATLTWLVLVGVERRTVLPWLAYGLLAALGLYVHFFVALVIATHGIWVLATRSIPPWRAVVAGLAPILLAAAPLPYIILEYGAEHEWIPPLNVTRILDAVTDLSGSTLLLGAFIGLIVVGAVNYRRDSRYWLLVGAALGPIVGALLISLVKPFFIPRYLIVSVPALAMIAGVTLAALRPNLLRIGAVALMGLALVMAVPAAYDHSGRINWQRAGRFVAERAQPGDMIVMDSWNQSPLMYYLARADASVRLEHVLIAEALGRHDGEAVWLSMTRMRRDDMQNMLRSLGLRYDVDTMRTFGPGTRIYRMVPRP